MQTKKPNAKISKGLVDFETCLISEEIKYLGKDGRKRDTILKDARPANILTAMPKIENNKKYIALIEDDEILSGLLVKKLERSGYDVDIAKDGVTGLRLIAEKKPDLVLLDMMMPKLSGFGVLERLNAQKVIPDLPLVIISNSGQSIEIERAMKLGARDYLIKVNFDPNEVLEKVNRILKPETKTEDAPDTRKGKETSGSIKGAVLIVEDDLFLVELLEKKFQSQNYKTFRASDVKQARAVLEKNSVDVILLDVVLPGTDGLMFLAELKASDKTKDIGVVIISNLGQKEEMEKGVKAGALDYIVKAHVTPGEIVARIENLLKTLRK